MLEGTLRIGTNGSISGKVFERYFAATNSRSTVREFNILSGSRVFTNRITTSRSTNVCVSTNRYLPAGAARGAWQTNILTNTVILQSSSSDFRINFGTGYFAKGRAYEEIERSDYRDNDGRWQSTSRKVGLDGAVFKEGGTYVGPFGAHNEYCP